MKALWLQHCIDTQALHAAQSTEKSLITHQKANYIKLTSAGDIFFSVEQKYRKLIVNRGNSKTTRIFVDPQSACVAFQHQVEAFENKGLLQAGE